MKHSLKKLISSLLTVIMVFSVLTIAPFTVNALGTANDIVKVAQEEVGVSGRPNKYTYWLGSINGSYSYAWCHAFVSWCADQAGIGDKIPKTASCATGVTWFKNRGEWQSRSSGYIPKAGDIIYFDYGANGTYDHVGIVTSSSGGRVYTIEGNASNAVKFNGGYSNGYSLNSTDILGYGTPSYSNPSPPTNATISANKYAYGLDDIIELTFNADGNVEYYGCQVWKDDKLVYGKETTNNIINIPCSELGSGKYAAYASCVNSYGNTISSVIEFYIAERLSNPQISINKQKFEINDTIVFNASADGCPDYYGLQVWKGDTVVYYETFTGHSINVPCEKLGVGDYGAFVSCVNPSGSIVTDTVSFRIGNELTNPQISINKNSFKISDVIEFSATADGGVDYYGLQVWKGDTVVYQEEFTGHTIGVSCDSLGCGEFGAFISCVNKLGVIFTDVITFTISSATANSLNYDNFDILLSLNSYTYDGTAKIPTVTVINDTTTLAKDIDYTVKYSNNINAGTATVTVIGIGNYTGTLTKTFIINKAQQTVNATISSNAIDIGNTSEITASGQGTISYTSSNTNVATVNNSGIVTGISAGTATITVTATGNNNYNEASKTFTVLVKSAHVLGDVNSDGIVSIADATTLQKYLAELTYLNDEQLAVADANGDGEISILDATEIQKYLAELIPSLG